MAKYKIEYTKAVYKTGKTLYEERIRYVSVRKGYRIIGK